MKPRTIFTRVDLAAIRMLMSRQRLDGMPPATPEHGGLSPSSPIVEKVMREIGVSRAKMSEAFCLARSTIGLAFL